MRTSFEIDDATAIASVSIGRLPQPDVVEALVAEAYDRCLSVDDGTFAPPLDEAGNSVKGQRVTKFLSERLRLNLFASKPFE